MKWLHYLIGPVRVFDVRWAADGGYTSSVFRCRPGTEPEEVDYNPETVRKYVWLLTVSGHGVVSKPADAPGIAARVSADAETFVASRADGVLSFVRRERLQPLTDELASSGVYPQRIEVARPPRSVADAFYDQVRGRDLLHLEERASSLAQTAARRLLLPVLGTFLLLLGVNAVIGPSLQTERGRLEMQEAQLRRTGEVREAGTAERNRLLGDFARRLEVPYAILCDRIGACVPGQVRLTALEIEPPRKRFESGKPLLRSERTVVVRGECDGSSEIGNFVRRLEQTGLARRIRLELVESRREGGLRFSLNLEL